MIFLVTKIIKCSLTTGSQRCIDFVGDEQITELERWCSNEKVRKNLSCPQTVQQYNKGMGGVDLVDMLLSLYQIQCNTKRWYQKLFWHLIDMESAK